MIDSDNFSKEKKAVDREVYTGGRTKLALTTKQLLFVWLFGGIVEWAIQYTNRALSPSTANQNLPFEAVFGHACVVLFVLWKWPWVASLSRIRPRLTDVAVGVFVGYLMTNISLSISGKTALREDWMLTNPHRVAMVICAVILVPIAEEFIYRAAILGSLLQKYPIVWAGAVTSIAAMLMHDSWLVALPDQVLLCVTYVVCRRSLSASIVAHATANALIFAPSLLVVFHLK